MRGFVDLIFCYEERWYLADYKSNHLGSRVGDYTPASLALSMASHHYYLQYLVYIVALHRYLESRLPDYDYEQHIGGVFYLFVRGMSRENPEGTGVFSDLPPLSLVSSLSNLFSGSDVSPGEGATR
jgi:exodeoxyribonuclease V beta subunit